MASVAVSVELAGCCALVVAIICLAIIATTRDRKSTRLNSSHANISYAVFCLKKKKKTQTLKTFQRKTHNSDKITTSHKVQHEFQAHTTLPPICTASRLQLTLNTLCSTRHVSK